MISKTKKINTWVIMCVALLLCSCIAALAQSPVQEQQAAAVGQQSNEIIEAQSATKQATKPSGKAKKKQQASQQAPESSDVKPASGNLAANTEDHDAIDVLTRKIVEKNDRINQLEAQINLLRKDSAAIARQQALASQHKLDSLNRCLTKSQKSLESVQAKLESQSKLMKAKSDSLNALNKIDTILYKQTLLYPLERRYDPQLIHDVMHCLNKLGLDNKFKVWYETYYDLVRDYGKYNEEVLSFLTRVQKGVELMHGNDNIPKTYNKTEIKNINDKLKKLSYYQFYIKRNNKYLHYKSIIYLDDVLAEFQRQLDNNKISARSLKKLIDKLEPKK